MERKAAAWRNYGEAAVLQILAPVLPEIARAIAEPLSRIDRITMVSTGGSGELGASKVTAEVARVLSQLPPVVESLTGVNLENLFARLRAAAPDLAGPAPAAAGTAGTGRSGGAAGAGGPPIVHAEVLPATPAPGAPASPAGTGPALPAAAPLPPIGGPGKPPPGL